MLEGEAGETNKMCHLLSLCSQHEQLKLRPGVRRYGCLPSRGAGWLARWDHLESLLLTWLQTTCQEQSVKSCNLLAHLRMGYPSSCDLGCRSCNHVLPLQALCGCPAVHTALWQLAEQRPLGCSSLAKRDE